MKKQRIRLHGIDTPESRTRDLVEKKFGLEAKRMILEWLPIDSTQKLITVKDKSGKFGRILGKFEIFDAEEDRTTTVNDWMINNYHAVAYHGQSKDDIANEHLKNYQALVEKNQIEFSQSDLDTYITSRS